MIHDRALGQVVSIGHHWELSNGSLMASASLLAGSRCTALSSLPAHRACQHPMATGQASWRLGPDTHTHYACTHMAPYRVGVVVQNN